MIIVVRQDVSQETLGIIMSRLEALGLETYLYAEGLNKVIAVFGVKDETDLKSLESLPDVEKVITITKPYHLVSREFKKEDTHVQIKEATNGITSEVTIGGKFFLVIAGPCAVESEEQLLAIAQEVKKAGASILRGGAYKPRTSPYAFQGLEEKGLQYLAKAREVTGLPFVTEVLDVRDVPRVASYADLLQIGARSMQNYALLKEAAHTNKPILLKRGLSATIEEWLLAAEYILREGNFKVILCERGIRTYNDYTRNTLDLTAVAAVKVLSHLPVIVDPSHGTGKWFLVPPLAKAACGVGAHGLMIEVHNAPSTALSDGEQSLTPANFGVLMKDIRKFQRWLQE